MPAAPAPTMTASTQPERGTSGAGAGRGAASAGAAVRTAAEEARKDRRLKRLMAHRVSSVARSTTERACRASEILSHRRMLAVSPQRCLIQGRHPTEPEPRQGDNDDRRGRQSARSDVRAAVSVGTVEIRRACPFSDRAYRHWPSSIAALARNHRRELGGDGIRRQRTRAAVDPHLDCFCRRGPRHHRRIGVLDAGGHRAGRQLLRRRHRARSGTHSLSRRACRQAAALMQALVEGLKTALLAVLVYLIALPFLLFAGAGLLIFFFASAYLLGREYFELAAMRHQPVVEAKELRKMHQSTVFLAGMFIAAFVLIPIVNLATPLFGMAFMVHVHQRIMDDMRPRLDDRRPTME